MRHFQCAVVAHRGYESEQKDRINTELDWLLSINFHIPVGPSRRGGVAVNHDALGSNPRAGAVFINKQKREKDGCTK